MKDEFSESSQVKQSNAVRMRLVAERIFRSTDGIAERLLPDPAGMDPTDAPFRQADLCG